MRSHRSSLVLDCLPLPLPRPLPRPRPLGLGDGGVGPDLFLIDLVLMLLLVLLLGLITDRLDLLVGGINQLLLLSRISKMIINHKTTSESDLSRKLVRQYD